MSATAAWKGLSPATRLYVAGVTITTAALTLALLPLVRWTLADATEFALLLSCSAVAAALVVSTGRNHGFHPAILFVAAAAMLLPPALVALLALAHLVQNRFGALKGKLPSYIAAFNVSNYALSGLAASGAVHAFGRGQPSAHAPIYAAAGLVACVALVLTNHALLALVLRLARGHSFRESGLFSWRSLSTDLGLAGLGIALAVIWEWNPLVAPAALAPLALVNRSYSLLALLQESENRFRALFESSAVAIAVAGPDGRVLDVNRAFEELVGGTAEALAGRPLHGFVHPEDGERGLDLLGELVDGRRDSYALEQRLVRADGGSAWAQLTSSLVRDADGRPRFVTVIAQDVTTRRSLEEQLRQVQKMEAIGQLAGGIAHDFNNMLTVITAHAGFVLDALSDQPATVREDVAAIEEAAEKARALTSQLLAFSRRQVVQPKVLDLNATVAEMHRLLGRVIGSDVEIVTSLGAGLGSIEADPSQLEQVIVNLAVNARDAMPEGGTLTLRTEEVELHGHAKLPPGRYVVLAVGDTGHGMDEQTRLRIFEPFFTTKDHKGTGLGLATVYGIVVQSGGGIDVRSAPGAGSTFTIYFPRVDEAAPPEASPAVAPRAAAGGETVLVVDDEDAVRTVARRILAAHGYRVVEAFDADDALRLVERRRHPIDLLVTDVVMPTADGCQLAERLRQVRPDLPVLFVSGFTREAALPEALAGAGTAFLQKPFTDETLSAKVADLLEASGTTTAAAA